MREHLLGLLVCVGLAGCGGGGGGDGGSSVPVTPTEAAIGGTVSGMVAGQTVLLTNNNAETLAVTGSGNFTFTKKITAGSNYSVALLTEPSGRNCTVTNGSGTVAAGATSVTTVSVSCTEAAIAMASFNVGVTVTGLLAGHSVTFTNNGTDTLTASSDGLYVFTPNYGKLVIYSGDPGGYNVAVQANPAGQTCTLTGASGMVGVGSITNFVNVQATCK